MELIREIEKGSFKICIYHEIDDSPDTSYMGEYSHNWETGAIDRKQTRDMERNEYRYFIPSPGCDTLENIYRRTKGKPTKERRKEIAEFMRYAMQDYKRIESLNRGDWCFIGIIAKVCKHNVELGSASLWGIESNCDDNYKEEIENEMVEEALNEAKLFYTRGES